MRSPKLEIQTSKLSFWSPRQFFAFCHEFSRGQFLRQSRRLAVKSVYEINLKLVFN